MHVHDDNANQLDTPQAEGLHIAVVTSGYHPQVTHAMRDAAIDTFVKAGGDRDNLLLIDAPGAWELGVLCSQVVHNTPVDGVLALGCVITGETTHDQWINAGLSHSLAALAGQSGVPVGFGLLTCPTLEHARARAGGEHGNKGADTMTAVLCSVNTIESLPTTEVEQ